MTPSPSTGHLGHQALRNIPGLCLGVLRLFPMNFTISKSVLSWTLGRFQDEKTRGQAHLCPTPAAWPSPGTSSSEAPRPGKATEGKGLSGQRSLLPPQLSRGDKPRTAGGAPSTLRTRHGSPGQREARGPGSSGLAGTCTPKLGSPSPGLPRNLGTSHTSLSSPFCARGEEAGRLWRAPGLPATPSTRRRPREQPPSRDACCTQPGAGLVPALRGENSQLGRGAAAAPLAI